LADTERPAITEKPSTTGASLQGLALQLRQTRTLVERVRQTATDLHDLAQRTEVPEDLQRSAAAAARGVEEAVQEFRSGIGTAFDENATLAARLAFEKRVMRIVADHQEIHLTLAALSSPPAKPEARGERPRPPSDPRRRR
jgi:hypothetical protein